MKTNWIKIEVQLTYRSSQTVNIDVYTKSDTSIRALAELVETIMPLYGLKWTANAQLIMGGQSLQYDKSLWDYGVSEGNALMYYDGPHTKEPKKTRDDIEQERERMLQSPEFKQSCIFFASNPGAFSTALSILQPAIQQEKQRMTDQCNGIQAQVNLLTHIARGQQILNDYERTPEDARQY